MKQGLRIGISLTLLLLFVLQPVCSAAMSYTVSEQQMKNIEQSTNELKRLIEILNQSSEISIEQLLLAEKKLAKLESLLAQSESHSKEIERLVGNYRIELENLKILYEKSERQRKKLELENKVLKMGIVGLLVFMIVDNRK